MLITLLNIKVTYTLFLFCCFVWLGGFNLCICFEAVLTCSSGWHGTQYETRLAIISLHTPGWPQTDSSAFSLLLNTGIKGVYHHTQFPIIFLKKWHHCKFFNKTKV